MARIKHYNHDTQQWEYSDISYSVQQGSDIDYEEVNELINAVIENKADVGHEHTTEDIADLQNILNEKVNKSDIPTSLPASDVYEWAKSPDKPVYTASEIGAITPNELNTHTTDKTNPHGVTVSQIGAAPATHTHTKSQITDFPASMPASDVSAWAKAATKPTYTAEEVGLGNVPNVATNDQVPTYSEASTLATLISGEKLSVIFGKIKKAITELIAHIVNKSNPHEVTAEQIGALDNSGDSMSGDLDMSLNNITSIGKISFGNEDNAYTFGIEGMVDGNVPIMNLIDEDTGMMGVLIRNVDTPQEGMDAVNKYYVDENTEPLNKIEILDADSEDAAILLEDRVTYIVNNPGSRLDIVWPLYGTNIQYTNHHLRINQGSGDVTVNFKMKQMIDGERASGLQLSLAMPEPSWGLSLYESAVETLNNGSCVVLPFASKDSGYPLKYVDINISLTDGIIITPMIQNAAATRLTEDIVDNFLIPTATYSLRGNEGASLELEYI